MGLSSALLKTVYALNRRQLSELKDLADALLYEGDSQPGLFPDSTERMVQEIRRGGVCLRLEYVNCGKGCKNCGRHGPYWYAYYRAGGKLHKRYVGKDLAGARTAIRS